MSAEHTTPDPDRNPLPAPPYEIPARAFVLQCGCVVFLGEDHRVEMRYRECIPCTDAHHQDGPDWLSMLDLFAIMPRDEGGS